MPTLITRRHALLLSAAAPALLLSQRARACDFFTTHLRVFHPWARESGPQDTSAGVFMLFDEVMQADRLIGAHTPLAESVELVVDGIGRPLDLEIPADKVTLLRETGTHLRLLGLKQPLKLGREYPLTLVFEHGGSVQADLDVDFTRDERLS
jgi:copper(I)-binding protein